GAGGAGGSPGDRGAVEAVEGRVEQPGARLEQLVEGVLASGEIGGLDVRAQRKRLRFGERQARRVLSSRGGRRGRSAARGREDDGAQRKRVHQANSIGHGERGGKPCDGGPPRQMNLLTVRCSADAPPSANGS